MVNFCEHCRTTVAQPCTKGEALGCTLRGARRSWMTRKSVPAEQSKQTNPKDAVGIKKAPLSTLSGPVLMEVALGCMEGALKYGRHNWRAAGIRYSVYYDATMRHLMLWWEGEDNDPDSGLSHVTKAICSLVVLRDAMIQGMIVDDRPPRTKQEWMVELNTLAAQLVDKYPEPVPAITEVKNNG